MTKRSGWRTAGLIAGVGCLSIIAVVVGGLVIATMWARATVANLGDPTPRTMERRIALPASTAADSQQSVTSAAGGPLRLTIDLQEGSFTIKPGPPGGDITVEGRYAPGLHELVETKETDASGVRRATVRFRSKAPAWARFFASIGDDGQRPELTITIPRGTPIDLSLQVAMGQSEIDLGGLTLTDVSVNASMGEHRIDFREPVVEGVRSLRLSNSMGNVILENLGNARADKVSTAGSMGNVTANLGGAWSPGAVADLSFEQSMGELTVRVPSTVRLDADVRNSSNQDSRRIEDAKLPDNPNAPMLRLRVTTSMGESRVIRY
jgi:hypothetical protein